MGKLLYSALASVDGFVADRAGRFDWAAPDEAVHQLVNDLLRGVGTQLCGRRMYETLQVWEHMADTEPVIADFAGIWRAAEKIVYSSTLAAPVTARTRIERHYRADAVRALKDDAAGDLSIGGPTLAAQALRDGLVDEIHLFRSPVAVGGGLAALPADLVLHLELLTSRTFDSGVTYTGYRVLDTEPAAEPAVESVPGAAVSTAVDNGVDNR
jgi:dihydrofolate reductase